MRFFDARGLLVEEEEHGGAFVEVDGRCVIGVKERVVDIGWLEDER